MAARRENDKYVNANEQQAFIVVNPDGTSISAESAVTSADLDTGAGTDTRAVVGIVLAASGGAAALAGGSGSVNTGTQRVVLATDVALPAGTNNIGRVGASVVEISGTTNSANTVAAAGNYDALDVISHSASNGVGLPWVWSNIARESGGSGTITRILLFSSAETMTARIRIWLFNAAPSTATEMDDGAAFLLDEDDMAKLIGWIDLPALARSGAAGEICATQWTGSFPFKCGADAHLRGILQFIDAETNEAASMSVFVKMQCVQD